VASYIVILFVTLLASEIAFWSMVPSLVSQEERFGFLLRNLAVSAIVGAIALRYLYIQYELRRQLLAESSSRLQALQSRIRPHFLFNSMNTIAALIKSQPDVAVETVEDLADLFRVSLMDSGRKHSLSNELEIARRYLRIEKLRLGNRLRVEWDINEAPVNAEILPMTLQPLVENAVYHGIEPMINGGIVQISCRLRDGEIHIRIMNSIGRTEQGEKRKGNRIAVENIRERLHLSYTPPGRMEVSDSGSYYTVEIVLPYRRADG
jgi:two-component system sensor histidine kinase AlgZ